MSLLSSARSNPYLHWPHAHPTSSLSRSEAFDDVPLLDLILEDNVHYEDLATYLLRLHFAKHTMRYLLIKEPARIIHSESLTAGQWRQYVDSGLHDAILDIAVDPETYSRTSAVMFVSTSCTYNAAQRCKRIT